MTRDNHRSAGVLIVIEILLGTVQYVYPQNSIIIALPCLGHFSVLFLTPSTLTCCVIFSTVLTLNQTRILDPDWLLLITLYISHNPTALVGGRRSPREITRWLAVNSTRTSGCGFQGDGVLFSRLHQQLKSHVEGSQGGTRARRIAVLE